MHKSGNNSDHDPIHIKFRVNVTKSEPECAERPPRISWKESTDFQRRKFVDDLFNTLTGSDFPKDHLSSNDPDCDLKPHKQVSISAKTVPNVSMNRILFCGVIIWSFETHF